MANLLEGKRALVTGAGRGIGVEIAKQLAAEGAHVGLAYRSSRIGAEEAATEIRSLGGSAETYQADLTNEAEANRLAAAVRESFGGLDILVNNAAGFGPLGPFAEMPWEQIDDEWQAVVKPVVLLTRAALPLLIESGEGKIVSMSASLLQRPQARYGAHAMAKAAVLAFTRTLAQELGPQNVTVNTISPGLTLTDFSQSLPETQKEAVRARTPLRRLATPEDVARAVLFFCSPLSNFVTGANIAPDGGLAIL